MTRVVIDLSTAADRSLFRAAGDLLFTVGWSEDDIFQFGEGDGSLGFIVSRCCRALAASANGQKGEEKREEKEERGVG